ncbi:MAG: TlpA disulfide reductase family protein [Bryobacteraceae bacterium]|jgi:thiol-disulfide isomerase/thioredoxin
MPPPRAICRRTAILTVVSAALSHRLGAEEGREPAPRFTAKTLDGEKFSNESLKGKVVLVQFWATWCQYCRRDQPAVDAIVEDFADKGLVVLAVNVGEPKRKVKQYLAQSPRACRVVLMEDTNLAALYAARSYPLYVLIDRDGNVAGRQKGAAGEDALRRLLRKAGLEGE